ncbi:MAG: mechanosensitive ion channel family protein, partial [Myxococcota bacterium]
MNAAPYRIKRIAPSSRAADGPGVTVGPSMTPDDPNSVAGRATTMLIEAFELIGWLGLAVSLTLIVLLRLLLEKSDRRLLRSPVLLLGLHVLFRLASQAVGKQSPWWETLYFFELLCLLFSVSRSAFLLTFEVLFKRRLQLHLPAIIRDIIQGVVYAGAAVVTLRAVGVDTSSLLTTSALLTAVIGLSLQDTLGNVFAGLAIQAQRPFEVDDWIQFEDVEGKIGRVVELNWRAVRVVTLDDVEVVIPNGMLAKAAIRNFSRPSSLLRRNLYVLGPYEVPPEQVEEAILSGLMGLRDVEPMPPPSVVVKSFDDNGVLYWVRYYTRSFQRSEHTDAQVRSRIWYAFNRRGIQIPFPVRTVRLAGTEAETRASRAEAATLRRKAALKLVDLFASLPEDALTQLAAASRTRLYASGERILQQGSSGDELFVVEHGCVSVTIVPKPDESIEELEVAQLRAGDFNQGWTTGGPFVAGLSSAVPASVDDSPDIASGTFSVGVNNG